MVPSHSAILPELILCRLPTGCSSPSTALTWLHTMGSTFQALTHTGHHRWQFPLPSCPSKGPSPQAATLSWAAPAGLSMGYASFRSHPLLPCGLLCGFTGRPSPHSALGLQGDGLLIHRPLLDFRELLLHTWSASCPPAALISAGWFLSHLSPLSPSCCRAAMFPFLNSILPEHAQRHS